MVKLTLIATVIVYSNLVYGQVLSNIRVLNHRDYMLSVIRETVKEIENRQWCNLKLSDIEQDIDEVILNWHLIGSVIYTNGFAVSIQQLDVLQSSVNQIWSNVGDGTVRVEIRGQLRMTDLALGYDVIAKLTDGEYRYTGMITHPLVQFDFSVFRNVHTHDMSVTVVGNQPRTTNVMSFMPTDTVTDALGHAFDSNSTFDGVTAWGSEVFQPILLDIVTNKVEFPRLCYNNCPLD